MTPRNRPNTSSHSKPALRWIFRRDSHAITCGLYVDTDCSYDVCLVPHWDVSSSVIEHFDVPALALLRHAELARRLRESGWTLTDYAAANQAGPRPDSEIGWLATLKPSRVH